MNKYWWTVSKRAWSEAAEFVGMGTRDKVILIILLQVVAALLIYFGLGEAELVKGQPSRLLVALAPFLVFPIVFLIKFPGVPKKIDKERQDQIASLESERLNEASIKNRRQKLAEFLRQAETLKNLCGSSHVLDEHLIEVWWNDVTTFLATEFGEDQLQVFKSDSGAPSNILVGPDIPQRNRDSWAWLNRRTFRLLVMLEPNTEAHRRSPLF